MSSTFAPTGDPSFFSTLKFSSGSSTLVTTRLVAVPAPQGHHASAPAIKLTAQEASAYSSPCSTERAYDALDKRKFSDNLARKIVKRRRVSPETHSRASSRIESPRATSLLSADYASTPSTRATSVASNELLDVPPRDCWTDDNGKAGPGFLSSEAVVQSLMKGYIQFFKNPDDPDDTAFDPHPTKYPVVYLEYPNIGAQERFVLLAPKDKDHYNPIMCLETALYTMIRYYLTPAQAALFGTLPDKDVTDDKADVPERSDSPYPTSEAPSPPSSEVSVGSSGASTSSLSTQSSLSSFSNSAISSASSLSSISTLSSYARKDSSESEPRVDYLRLLRRAIKKRDGPLFIQIISALNALLCLLKYPPLPLDLFEMPPANHICASVKRWRRIPTSVVHRIADETYQRAVGPHIDVLKRYEAFSSEVYGELMPIFVSDVIRATGLHEGSLFLDMGSGVGNVVMQASLETGCRSYGIEIMPGPAQIARSQLEQFKIRCRMWGVKMGEVGLEEGDMLKSSKVDELVKSADVVLVNNKVFLEPLNEALRQKFLDLKEGAIVVSLKCLMGSGRSAARERSASPALKERNLDDISEIFTVTARPYYPGSVSWGGGGGEYFLQRMNREDYARRKMLFENSRAGSARSTRSRR